MEPQTNNEPVQVSEKSGWHSVTPQSKYLAMALFVSLPFLGGFVGYNMASNNLNEFSKMDEQSSTPVSEEYPFSIEDVTVNADRLVFSNGNDVYERYRYPISWNYKPGVNGDPPSAYISATIVDEEDNEVSRVYGIGETGFKDESYFLHLEALCSVRPGRPCTEENDILQEKNYRIKIEGANCTGGPAGLDPRYCDGKNKEPIKPAYSNWFKLSTNNLNVRSLEKSRGFSVKQPDNWRIEATEEYIQIFNYSDSDVASGHFEPKILNKIEGGYVTNLSEVADLSEYEKKSYADGFYYRRDTTDEYSLISVLVPYKEDESKALRFAVYGDLNSREETLATFLAGFSFN